MESRTLVADETGLRRWLQATMAQRRVFAPCKEGEFIRLKVVSDAADVVLDFGITRNSPREVFSPISEDILAYRLEGRAVSFAPVELQPPETLLFGIRACDAKSVAVTDKVFDEAGDKVDNFYALRRQNTVLAVLWCASMRPWCRCGSFGSPLEAAEAHADILVTPIGGAFTFDGLTEKGKELLSQGDLLSPASEAQIAQRDATHRRTVDAAASQPPISALAQDLDSLWEHPVWKEVAQRCLGCGICTYLCPTCTCFDILDECPASLGRRYRCWDTCQFADFTVHASGHNPRPDQAARLRQRILHKFKYGPELTGLIGCVGCGRCLELCPVAIRYTEILERLNSPEPVAAASGEGEQRQAGSLHHNRNPEPVAASGEGER